MNKNVKLEMISDDDLLLRLSRLVQQSRRVESVLVAHIAEVDARGLFRREACSSMFAYYTDVLKLSEHEAYLRIKAARASRKHPVLLEMLDDGRVHLSGIVTMAPHLDDLDAQQRESLLRRATHQGKRNIEELVAEVAPKPDVPTTVRKLPQRRERPVPKQASQQVPEPVERREGLIVGPPASSDTAGAPPKADAGSKRGGEVQPLALTRYRITFTAGAELRDKLERLQGLMRSSIPDGDLAAVIEDAVTEKLERLEARRFGKTKAPRKSLQQADTSPGSRYIPAAVKRVVVTRDGHRCTFESADGRRCRERRGLEFHHETPFGLGGDRSTDNVRLLCKTHNLYMAEMDYGKEKIDRYRGSGDRVREHAPSFELAPDRLPGLLFRTPGISFVTMHGAAPWPA